METTVSDRGSPDEAPHCRCAYEEGPPGRGIDKERAYTGTWAQINELTVLTSDGEEETFSVTPHD